MKDMMKVCTLPYALDSSNLFLLQLLICGLHLVEAFTISGLVPEILASGY